MNVSKQNTRFALRRLTQTVETVEKVPFQKLIFEKWDKNAEKRLVFSVPHNILAIFWLFFSLLWDVFLNTFRTRAFSTVSLRRIDKIILLRLAQ